MRVRRDHVLRHRRDGSDRHDHRGAGAEGRVERRLTPIRTRAPAITVSTIQARTGGNRRDAVGRADQAGVAVGREHARGVGDPLLHLVEPLAVAGSTTGARARSVTSTPPRSDGRASRGRHPGSRSGSVASPSGPEARCPVRTRPRGRPCRSHLGRRPSRRAPASSPEGDPVPRWSRRRRDEPRRASRPTSPSNA